MKADSGRPLRKIVFFDSEVASADLEAARRYEEQRRTSRPLPATPPGSIGVAEYMNTRAQTRLVLSEGLLHLTEVKLAPGTRVPHHRHGADQIVLVTQGTLWQGNREVRAGCGFFTPAGSVYGFRAGPEGVTLHEFYHAEVEDWAPEVIEDDIPRWTQQTTDDLAPGSGQAATGGGGDDAELD